MYTGDRYFISTNTVGSRERLDKKNRRRIEVNPTLPETTIAPENGWLEYYFPIGEAYFQGLR